MQSLDLAVIGNCEIAGLVDRQGRIVWMCIPRLDGDPVFNALLAGEDDAAGVFSIELEGGKPAGRRYLENTAVLQTDLAADDGSAIRITDHVPRFERYGRTFRPATVVRHIAPTAGRPRITVRLRPRFGYGAYRPATTRGSNHVRYVLDTGVLRLTTNGPVELIANETTFVLDRPIVLVLGPDETITEGVEVAERTTREATSTYWRNWSRSLAIPFEWQDVVIRAAITLKLCMYEQTGAIVAALTTSIPEYGTPGRNWDYRFCWLRDSFFVVQTLNRLGATAIMERYMSYVTNVVAGSESGYLQPLFGLSFETELTERQIEHLSGYRGWGPVRVGNAAYTQVQNDSYGSVILALAQSFFDTRIERRGDLALFHMLERLGEQAERRWNEPDAGVWEFRTRASVHTHSSIMCWVAVDRLSKIARRLGLAKEAARWTRSAEHIHAGIVDGAWNAELNSFTATFGGTDTDASLLLIPELGFVPARDPRFLGTLDLVERRLKRGDHLFRYADADDFGVPESAFTICTLWLAEALARVGRLDEAREVFAGVLAARNDVGLLSEGLALEDGALWGNFPQTYSMVGLIRVARLLSTPWEDAF